MSEQDIKDRVLRAFADWAVYSANWVGEKYGEDAVQEYFRYILTSLGNRLFQLEGREILKALQTLNNNLGSGTAYEEDDERAVLTVQCNTGGRAEREGKSLSGPGGVPYYCMHCKIHLEDMARERGKPMTMQYAPEGKGCKFIYEKKVLTGK